MKGIILAGGSGTRLNPMTRSISKQLLPVFNKPMIYYPLSILMLAGIRDILIISTPHDLSLFERLLQDGSQLGVNFQYAPQPNPGGLAEAFIIGKDFVGNDNVCLILGDNIFYGAQMEEMLCKAANNLQGATLFGYQVKDPERYGVIEYDSHKNPINILEKPAQAPSDIAVTGLYFYDNEVLEIASNLKPSPRGELEITDVNNCYLKNKKCHLEIMGRGFAWLDTGTFDSLLQASQFVQVIEERQGVYISCPEEIAFHKNFISVEQLAKLGQEMSNNAYGQNLLRIAQES